MVNKSVKNDSAKQLKTLVTVLVNKGLQKKTIALELGIKGPNVVSILHKLCNNNVQSYNGISTKEFISKLRSNPVLSPNFGNANIDVSDLDLVFFFHYWSSNQELHSAVIGINRKNPKLSSLTYLIRQPDGIHLIDRIYSVKSFEFEDNYTIDIVIGKKNKAGATFISAHKGQKLIEDIKFSFCSYCGAMTANQVNYAGIGILEQVKKEKFNGYMDTLNSKGVHPSIVNALYRRRFDLHHTEDGVYNTHNDLYSSQKEPLNHISGYWVGYYLRRMIEGPEKSGGLVKVIMTVEESGIATMNFIGGEYRENRFPDRLTYNGIFQFPQENSVSVIVGKFQPTYKTNRLKMLLKYDDRKLTGTFSGWRVIDSSYFTTAIYFEKIEVPAGNDSKETILENLFKEHKPARYHRSNLSGFEGILTTLRQIEDRVFDTVTTCTGSETK